MIMDLLLSSFYVDVFFPLSLSRLLPDLTEYMSNTADILQEPETACINGFRSFRPHLKLNTFELYYTSVYHFKMFLIDFNLKNSNIIIFDCTLN